MEFILYLVAGAISGLLSGLFGVGGGLIIVPILTFLFVGLQFPEAHIMHLALGTSLASIALTSISSARAHHHRDNVNWTIVKKTTPGLVIGTLLGTLVAAQFDSSWLKIIFVVFVFSVAGQLFFNYTPGPQRQLPGQIGISGAGALIGAVSSLVGIGGATLSVPYLVYCNTDIRSAIGTSAAIGLPIALAGTLGYVLTGSGVEHLPKLSLGFVYLPAVAGITIASVLAAPAGVSMAQRLPAPKLKRRFAILITIIGIAMLWDLF
ncbi:MAG TPA: sulfite exporter TauE/SafE family protein [Methylophilaceae bacterium]|nr:sulfite exporter TauE/SafE family protein [Methylophilaceae bacterium]